MAARRGDPWVRAAACATSHAAWRIEPWLRNVQLRIHQHPRARCRVAWRAVLVVAYRYPYLPHLDLAQSPDVLASTPAL